MEGSISLSPSSETKGTTSDETKHAVISKLSVSMPLAGHALVAA